MSKRLLYAAVADDDTGASDLAGMFADTGARVVLVLDVPPPADLERWTEQAYGVVFATATRAQSRDTAYTKTAEAVRAALSLDPQTVQVKYCSTFDSTEQGNIGPSIDAALDETGEEFTIALPALPVNGRTTYNGYHFVKGVLLSDSPMRFHPMTPMTNSDLVSWLGLQTSRRVGLTPYAVVEQGAAAIERHWSTLRADGVSISIVDCLKDEHAAAICEAACSLRVISGGSAFGTHLPPAWTRRHWFTPDRSGAFEDLEIEPGRGALVVAGSCSTATAAQNEAFTAHGAETIQVDARDLIERGLGSGVDAAAGVLRAGGSVLLKTRSSLDDIECARSWGLEQGWDSSSLGLRIADELASAVRAVVEAQRPSVLISAGGETSSAVCRKLGIRALAVGRNIQPGVPMCLPMEGPAIPVVLKSGNFGTPDFYERAIEAASKLSHG